MSEVAARLGDRPWARPMLESASRLGVDGDHFAVEIPLSDGYGRQVGRLAAATTDAGRVRFYHEGERGFVRPNSTGRDQSEDTIVHLQDPLSVFSWEALGLDGLSFVAECGRGRRCRADEFADRDVLAIYGEGEESGPSDAFVTAHLSATRAADKNRIDGCDPGPVGTVISAEATLADPAITTGDWSGRLDAPPQARTARRVAAAWWSVKSGGVWEHRRDGDHRTIWRLSDGVELCPHELGLDHEDEVLQHIGTVGVDHLQVLAHFHQQAASAL